MTIASTHTAARTAVNGGTPSIRELVGRGVRGGLIASVAMAMVMMVLGSFDRGFFAAPSAIWAFFAGPEAYVPHTLSLGFLIGGMGHMMNSALFGIVFAFVAARALRLRGIATAMLAGTVYALAILALMWNVVLPLGPYGQIVMDSAALWIWTVGHVAYGMAAGFLYGQKA